MSMSTVMRVCGFQRSELNEDYISLFTRIMSLYVGWESHNGNGDGRRATLTQTAALNDCL